MRPIARRPCGTLPIVDASTAQRGAFGSPSGFALAVTLNGKPCRVPAMAHSRDRLLRVVAGLELVNASGGFDGKLLRAARSELQLVLHGVPDPRGARQHVEVCKADWLGSAADSLPRHERRRGVAPALLLTQSEPHRLEARLWLEPNASLESEPMAPAPASDLDALRLVARAILPRLCGLGGAGATSELREVVRERVRVRCVIHARAIGDRRSGPRQGRLATSVERGLKHLDLALCAPHAAADLNQSVLGAVSRVALALGHDPRFVSSEGHTHAMRFGGCAPIIRFERREAFIIATLELPLNLSPHGRQGAPQAKAALHLTQIHGADDRRLLAGCIGLASQLPMLEAVIGEAQNDANTARKGP